MVLSTVGFYPQGCFKGEEKPEEGKDEGGEGRLSISFIQVVTWGNTAHHYQAGYNS